MQINYPCEVENTRMSTLFNNWADDNLTLLIIDYFIRNANRV